MVDIALLEHSIREDLNQRAPRVMAVLRPLRVVIDNYPEGQTEELDAVNNPEDPSMGTRKVPFSRVLYIEPCRVSQSPSTNPFSTPKLISNFEPLTPPWRSVSLVRATRTS